MQRAEAKDKGRLLASGEATTEASGEQHQRGQEAQPPREVATRLALPRDTCALFVHLPVKTGLRFSLNERMPS